MLSVTSTPVELIDDNTAQQYYNDLDTLEGAERDSRAEALRLWADQKDADQKREQFDTLNKIYSDFDGYVNDAGLQDFDEESRYRTANRQFIASQFDDTVENQQTIYPSFRDKWTESVAGKKGLSEKETFDLIKQGIDARNEVSQAANEIPGDIALALFDSLDGGDPVDVPKLIDTWKTKNAESIKKLPKGWETPLLEAAQKYYTETDTMLRDYAEPLKQVYDHFAAVTGRDTERAGESNPKNQEELDSLVDTLASMPKPVRERAYASVVLGAKKAGQDPKTFMDQWGESWSRTLNMVRTGALTAQEMAAESEARQLEDKASPPDYYISKSTGEKIPLANRAFHDEADLRKVTPEEIAADAAKARQKVKRFEVVRELQSVADNQFDPIEKINKGGFLGFMEAMAYGTPQSLAYTGTALIPVVGPYLAGTAIFADEYNQLREQGMSVDQAVQVGSVSAGIQAGLERTGAELIFGKLPIFEKLMRRIANPARVGKAGSAGIRFFSAALGENITEGAQDLTTPLVQDVAEALGADVPDVQWQPILEKWSRSRLDVLAATIPTILLGTGVATFGDNKRFAQFEERQDIYRSMGMDDATIKEIEDGKDISEKQQKFQTAFSKLTPENVKTGVAYMEEKIASAQGQQQDPNTPTLTRATLADGTTQFIVRDEQGRIAYRTAEEQSAQIAMRELLRNQITGSTRGIVESLQFIDQVNQAAGRGEDVQKLLLDGAPRTLLDDYEANPTQQNLDNLFATVRAFGQDINEPAELANFPVLASNQGALAEGIFKSVIRIQDGATGVEVMRDFSQDNLKRAIGEGRVTMDWVREQLNQVIPLIESDRLEGRSLRTETDTDVIESFSDVAVAYMNGRIRDEQVPAGFRGFLRRMAIVVKDIFRRAYRLKRAIAEGKVDSNFESFLAESVGLNQQTLLDTARERVSNEVLTDTNYSIGAAPVKVSIEGLSEKPVQAREQIRSYIQKFLQGKELVLGDTDKKVRFTSESRGESISKARRVDQMAPMREAESIVAAAQWWKKTAPDDRAKIGTKEFWFFKVPIEIEGVVYNSHFNVRVPNAYPENTGVFYEFNLGKKIESNAAMGLEESSAPSFVDSNINIGTSATEVNLPVSNYSIGLSRNSISQVSDKDDPFRVGTAKLGTSKVPKDTPQDSNISGDNVPDDLLAKQMEKMNYAHLPKNILSEKDPKKKRRKLINWFKKNLLALHDAFPEEFRARATHWYDGANRIAKEMGSQFKASTEQASGVIAVFSPQKDWFMNVAQAEQFMELWTNSQDVVLEESLVRAEIEGIIEAATVADKQKRKKVPGETKEQTSERREYNKALDKLEKEKRRKIVEQVIGKTIRDLDSTPTLQAWAIRVLAQVTFGRNYRNLSPEGDRLGMATNDDGALSKNGWGSTNEIEKAVRIMKDGSLKNISNNLGNEHKVRNFYNNIVAPNTPYGDATIDTHAVAAAHLMPYGAKATEVGHNFGSGMNGSEVLGISGVYHLYLDAYREAAADRGILPRQMQSITWEAIRLVYPAATKNATTLAKSQKTWKDLTDDNARNTLVGGRIPSPVWAGANDNGESQGFSSGLQENGSRDVSGGGLLSGVRPAGAGRDGGVNYSIASQSEIDRVNRALGGMNRGPNERLAIYERAKKKFAQVLQSNKESLDAIKSATPINTAPAIEQVESERASKLADLASEETTEVEKALQDNADTFMPRIEAAATLAERKRIERDAKDRAKILEKGIRDKYDERKTAIETEANTQRQQIEQSAASRDSASRARMSEKVRRTKLLQAIGELDAILSVLPPEVRGRVGGFAVLANIGTGDKALGDFFRDRIKKIDTELEKVMVREYTEAITKAVKQSRPKAGDNGVRKSTLGAETQKFADTVYRATLLDDEATAKRMAEIEAALNAPDATAEDISALSEEWSILNTFGDLDNRSSETLAQGLDWLKGQLQMGREAWRIKEQARIDEQRARNAATIEWLGKGTAKKRFADKGLMQRIGETANNYILDHASFEQFVTAFLPPEIAANFSERLRKADMAAQAAEIRDGKGILDAVRAGAKAANMSPADAMLWLKGDQKNAVAYLEGRKVKDERIAIDLAQKIATGEADRSKLTDTDVETLRNELAALPADTQKEFVTIKRVIYRGDDVKLDMSRAKAIQLLLSWNQPDVQIKMRKEGWTDESAADLQALVNDPVSSKVMAYAKELYGKGAGIVNPVYSRMFGMNMPQVKNYAPTRFLNAKDTKDIGLDGSPTATGTTPGFAKSRVTHSAKIAPEDALTVMQGHIAQQAHWVHFAELAREFRALLSNPEVRESIKQNHGDGVLKSAELWADQMEQRGGNKARESAWLNSVIGTVLSGKAISSLGFNLKTLAMQLENTMRFGLALDTKQIVSALSNPSTIVEDIQTVWESDAIQNRLQGGATAEARFLFSRYAGKPNFAAKIAEASMTPINWLDSAATSISSAIVYRANLNDALASGMPENLAKQAALDAASESIYRFAQPVSFGQKSIMENNGNVFAKTFFLFMSDPRLKTAILADAARGLATGRGKASEHIRRIVAVELMAIVSHVISSAFRDAFSGDDDEEIWNLGGFAKAILLAPLQGFFFAGTVGELAISKLTGQKFYTSTQNPLLTSMEQAIRAGTNMEDAINFDDPEAMLKEWNNIFRSMALTPTMAAPAVLLNMVKPALGFYQNTTTEE